MKSLYFSWIYILIAAFLPACIDSQAQKTGEESSATVQTVPVQIEPIKKAKEQLPIMVSGKVASQEEVKLSFKIGGVITAVYVREGEKVRKGQVLAKLDPSEINAQVAQAKSALDKATRDLERGTRLYEDTVATLEQVQDLTTAKEVAAANLEIAAFNQGRSVIYAPASGKILKRFAEKGEVIGPGSPVFFLAANGRSQVIRTGLSDVDLVKINMGDRAEVNFNAFPGKTFLAQVSEIAAGADARTGTFEVELSLQNPPHNLKDGFVGKIHIYPATTEEMALIPSHSIVDANSDRIVVYVTDVAKETAQRLEINDYTLGNHHVSVPAKSVDNHAFVITDGAQYLRPGTGIRVANLIQNQVSQQ